MIVLGTTLRCNEPPRHLWIVLSDPAATGGKVLLVNLTTLTERCIDDVCVLNASDYSLLSHATTVAYSRRDSGTASGLQSAVDAGYFVEVTPIPRTAFQKVLNGAHVTRELSAADKALLPALGTPSSAAT